MQKNQTMRIIITIVIIALIGFLGYWAFSGNNNAGNDDTENTPAVIDNDTTASSSQIEEGGAGLTSLGIVVDEQNPGRIVVVTQVVLNNPAWVVIHEDAGGKPGAILGARMFEKGSNSGVIQLLNSMKVNKSYYAVIHTEDGNGKFEVAKDLILKDANGKEVMTKFAVTQGSDKPQ